MQLVAVEKGGAAEPNRSRRSCKGSQRCKTREREVSNGGRPTRKLVFFVGRSLLFVWARRTMMPAMHPELGMGKGTGEGVVDVVLYYARASISMLGMEVYVV